MWRGASLALLLASFLTPSLAQRAGTGFRGFPKADGHFGHIRQRAFSNGQLRGHFHHSDGLGAFFSPYFFEDNESSGWQNPGAEPVGAEATPQAIFAQPERETPPADAQVIEIPGASKENEEKPQLPAIFVLINGERIMTQRFVLTVSSLSVNLDRQERVIPLEAVDLSATKAANQERGINLRIPDDHNEISLSF